MERQPEVESLVRPSLLRICLPTYGLLHGLLVPEELHGDHGLHVLVQLIHEGNP